VVPRCIAAQIHVVPRCIAAQIHVVPRLREALYEASHPGPRAVDPGEVALVQRRALAHLPRGQAQGGVGAAAAPSSAARPVVHIVKYEARVWMWARLRLGTPGRATPSCTMVYCSGVC